MEVPNEKDSIDCVGLYRRCHLSILLLAVFNCIRTRRAALPFSSFLCIYATPRYSSRHSPLSYTLVARSTPR